MLITCIISLIIFVVSLLTSCLWISFFNNIHLLFLIPIILGLFILFYIIEIYVVEKYKLNKTIYNVVTMQIPAIISIFFALIFWIMNMDPLIVRMFLSTCKYILIPIMLIRLFVELLSRQETSLIVSCGITLGLILGILFIN